MSESERFEIKSKEAPEAIGPYNQAVSVSASRLVFVSGQIGLDPSTGEIVPGGVGPQTEQCIENVMAIVKAAGGGPGSIVKTTVYLAEIGDFPLMNEHYGAVLKAPYPARACVGGCDLPKGALVEIEAVAALEGGHREA